jgi:O-antigen/teichoic acid export membrane protein
MSRLLLLKGAVWTVGSYGVNQFFRLLANIILARLLAPELFGIMLIVNSLRTGADLMSDLGIGQNIVKNKNGDNPAFYNTAWSLQVIRGFLLWMICAAVALPIARFYQSPTLGLIIPVASIAFVFSGLSSVSRFILQRRLQFAKLNFFETAAAVISSFAHVLLAYFTPTIWALVWGSLVAYAAPMVASYFLVPGVRHRFFISKEYAKQIFTFGVWIFASSIVYFLSTNFDALYLAKNIPLALLGVYGIARSIADPLSTLSIRLGSILVFPVIASMSHLPRDNLRAQFSATRLRFFALASVVYSLCAAMIDIPISLVYDQRYHAATWMLPILLLGAWFSTLCSLNEASLLGLGRPSYGALGNTLKFGYLLVALPFSFAQFGVVGCVIAIAMADLPRYLPIRLGQIREGFSFGTQDLLTTLLVFGLTALWEWLRWELGWGTSFDGFGIVSQ